MFPDNLQHPKQPSKRLKIAPITLTALYYIDLKGDE